MQPQQQSLFISHIDWLVLLRFYISVTITAFSFKVSRFLSSLELYTLDPDLAFRHNGATMESIDSHFQELKQIEVLGLDDTTRADIQANMVSALVSSKSVNSEKDMPQHKEEELKLFKKKLGKCKAELKELLAPLMQTHVAASNNMTGAPSMFSLLCWYCVFYFCFFDPFIFGNTSVL